MPNMNPKPTRAHIVSIYGYITGLKKDITSIKKNDLNHILNDVEKLGGKIDKIYWVLLVDEGTVAKSLINKFFMYKLYETQSKLFPKGAYQIADRGA